MGIAGLADALIPVRRSALVGRGCQAGQGPDLATIAKLPPAEELHDEDPGAPVADAIQQHQLSHLLVGTGIGGAEQGPLFGLQDPNPLREPEPLLPSPLQPGMEPWRKR